jgi:hypothetical protein
MLPEGRTIFVTQFLITQRLVNQLLVNQFLFKTTTNQGNSGKCFVLNLPDW